MARHLFRCPLRWGDMDQLGHVNNVIYVDYLQEARVDMMRVHPPTQGGEALAEGVVVVRHEVKYLRPLVFRLEPVLVEVWVSEVNAATFTLAYEIFDETPEGRVVYLRARSVLVPYVFDGEYPRRLTTAEREVLAGFLEPEPRLPSQVRVGAGTPRTYPCAVRFSDVDVYRHVNNVKYFDYYQEARIWLMATAGRMTGTGDFHLIVAQLDVDYRTPILFREEPYPVDVWVTDVGHSSFVIAGAIRDGDTVLSTSRCVLVNFDPATGRSVPLPPAHREWLVTLGDPV